MSDSVDWPESRKDAVYRGRHRRAVCQAFALAYPLATGSLRADPESPCVDVRHAHGRREVPCPLEKRWEAERRVPVDARRIRAREHSRVDQRAAIDVIDLTLRRKVVQLIAQRERVLQLKSEDLERRVELDVRRAQVLVQKNRVDPGWRLRVGEGEIAGRVIVQALGTRVAEGRRPREPLTDVDRLGGDIERREFAIDRLTPRILALTGSEVECEWAACGVERAPRCDRA